MISVLLYTAVSFSLLYSALHLLNSAPLPVLTTHSFLSKSLQHRRPSLISNISLLLNLHSRPSVISHISLLLLNLHYRPPPTPILHSRPPPPPPYPPQPPPLPSHHPLSLYLKFTQYRVCLWRLIRLFSRANKINGGDIRSWSA